MYYIEALFARRMFSWFGGIVVCVGIMIIAVTLSLHNHVIVNGKPPDGKVPIAAVFVVAGYLSCIMATMLAATLNRDRSHLAYIWTRPQPRERIALSYILVDVLTIVLAYALVSGVCLVVFSKLPVGPLVPNADLMAVVFGYLSLPLMWYGLVEVATSWNGLKGSSIAGLSWAVFWGLLLLRAFPLPTPFGQVVAVLSILNPLAYFTTKHGMGITVGGPGTSTLVMSDSAQTFVAYGIFLISCTVAIYAWKRMEA